MPNPAAPTVPANATFTFDRYDINDNGINLTFLCANPGPGNESYWTVRITDAELATVRTDTQAHTLADVRALAVAKLQRRIRGSSIANLLDGAIGQSVTI
jgi:hypothetical protein